MIKKQSVQQMKIIQNQTYTSSEAGPMNSNIIRYKNGLSKVNNSILLTVIALFLNLQMIKKQSVEWMKRIQNRTCTSGEACPIDSMIIMKVKIVHGQAKKNYTCCSATFPFVTAVSQIALLSHNGQNYT